MYVSTIVLVCYANPLLAFTADHNHQFAPRHPMQTPSNPLGVAQPKSAREGENLDIQAVRDRQTSFDGLALVFYSMSTLK